MGNQVTGGSADYLGLLGPVSVREYKLGSKHIYLFGEAHKPIGYKFCSDTHNRIRINDLLRNITAPFDLFLEARPRLKQSPDANVIKKLFDEFHTMYKGGTHRTHLLDLRDADPESTIINDEYNRSDSLISNISRYASFWNYPEYYNQILVDINKFSHMIRIRENIQVPHFINWMDIWNDLMKDGVLKKEYDKVHPDFKDAIKETLKMRFMLEYTNGLSAAFRVTCILDAQQLIHSEEELNLIYGFVINYTSVLMFDTYMLCRMFKQIGNDYPTNLIVYAGYRHTSTVEALLEYMHATLIFRSDFQGNWDTSPGTCVNIDGLQIPLFS
jgi:hypothetical protein